jgi:hypothetical protein
VYVYGRSIAQELVDRGEVQVFSPPARGRSSEHNLGDVFLTNEISHNLGYAAAFPLGDLCANVLGKLKIRRQSFLIGLVIVLAQIHIDDVQLAAHRLGHASAACDQILRCRIRADANRNSLSNRNRSTGFVFLSVGFQTLIYCLRHLTKRQFSEGNEIPRAKEITQSATDPV